MNRSSHLYSSFRNLTQLFRAHISTNTWRTRETTQGVCAPRGASLWRRLFLVNGSMARTAMIDDRVRHILIVHIYNIYAKSTYLLLASTATTTGQCVRSFAANESLSQIGLEDVRNTDTSVLELVRLEKGQDNAWHCNCGRIDCMHERFLRALRLVFDA